MSYEPAQLRVDVLEVFAEAAAVHRRDIFLQHVFGNSNKDPYAKRADPVVWQFSRVTPYSNSIKKLAQARRALAKKVKKRRARAIPKFKPKEGTCYWNLSKRKQKEESCTSMKR